jgi:hypothetical protein
MDAISSYRYPQPPYDEKVIFDDGSRYTGSLLNGKPHGYGTLRHSNGSVQEGEWKNGELIRCEKFTCGD